mgnify:CR=1 FL=1
MINTLEKQTADKLINMLICRLLMQEYFIVRESTVTKIKKIEVVSVDAFKEYLKA